MWASNNNHTDVAQLLLSRGGQVNLQSKVRPNISCYQESIFQHKVNHFLDGKHLVH